MQPKQHQLSLELRNVVEGPTIDGVAEVVLDTDKGAIACRYHPAGQGDAGIVWVFGAGGGLGGPAGGLYPRLAAQLVTDGIASLRLDYRQPNHLSACVLDTLLGVAYLGQQGRTRVALVGHSFGGAVVITAGAVSEQVVAVAALSSQTYGADLVDQLSPRPLLHGTADEIFRIAVPAICIAAHTSQSRSTFIWAAGTGWTNAGTRSTTTCSRGCVTCCSSRAQRRANDPQHNCSPPRS